MTREANGIIYTHAGPEIGVASTKAFTCQLAALFLLTLYLGQSRQTIDPLTQKKLGLALIGIAEVVENELPRLQKEINTLIERYYEAKDFLFVGRGLSFPIALEGALKLKEISYIHAEGYAAGEMKHGPIALVDDNLPVIVVAPKDDYYEKIVSNIQEVKARKGNVIAIVTEGDVALKEMVNDSIEIPDSHPALAPLLAVIPLQMLAYHIALMRGCNVDQPRNLAKSVTVE
jgi:glucosamine--fructose-6-phosphate aminotransferase (isomerizing)